MMGYGAAAYRGELDDDNQFESEPADPPHQVATRATQGQAGIPRTATTNIPRLPSTPRTRLISKQLSALIAISRKLGMDLAQFRQEVRSRYGTQVEFITKAQASELIGEMSNGAPPPRGRDRRRDRRARPGEPLDCAWTARWLGAGRGGAPGGQQNCAEWSASSCCRWRFSGSPA
jgi:hypothetical protein